MKKISSIKRNLGSIQFMIAIAIGIILGFLVTEFSVQGPFSTFSVNPLFDSMKIIILIICSALLLYIIANQISKKFVILILVALFLRILIVFAMSFFGFLPYQYDNNWDIDASILLADWHSGYFHFDINGEGVKLYSKITTIVYYLLGENPIYMQLINVFFSAFSIYYLYMITNYIATDKVAYITSAFMALWPSYIFFSSMHMREALAIFFIVALIYYFIKWLKDFNLKYLLITSFFIILSSLIRPQNAVLMLLVILPFVFYYTWIYSNKYLKIILLFGTTMLTVFALALLQSKGYLSYFNFDYISNEMNYRANGGTGYLEWMTYGSITEVILYAPIRFIFFVYTPFPWHVTNVSQVAAFFEALLLIIMSYYILKHFKSIWRNNLIRRELFFIITFCVVGLLANGIIDSNVGTAIRHKLQYIFLFFILFNMVRYNKNRILPRD